MRAILLRRTLTYHRYCPTTFVCDSLHGTPEESNAGATERLNNYKELLVITREVCEETTIYENLNSFEFFSIIFPGISVN